MGGIMSIARLNILRQASAIEQLNYVIETPEYKRIVSLVTGVAKDNYSSRILMAGVGKNANIATKIAETMSSLGIPAFALNVSHLGHGDYAQVGPNDVIIYISRSGTTREILTAIDHLALIRHKVFQVLIHCKPNKPRHSAVNLELCIGAVDEGDEHGLAPTTSTTALLCILDCISVEASSNIGFKRTDFLRYHPDGALGDLLKKEAQSSTTTDRSNGHDQSKDGLEFA
jgi:D-arabinose 5-phosphate isomerase GutQ